MRKNANETSKRDGKVDLMKSVNYAEKRQREDQMSKFESRKKRDDESDFDDEEELGLSIENFSKSYNSSILPDKESNKQTFKPHQDYSQTCHTVLHLNAQ